VPVASDFGYLATSLSANSRPRVVLRYPKWTLAAGHVAGGSPTGQELTAAALVLEQSCDQGVDHVVVRLGAGRHDGLGGVQELADDV